jgi:hypothetical protein
MSKAKVLQESEGSVQLTKATVPETANTKCRLPRSVADVSELD